MAKFRIETVLDKVTGRYFTEVYQEGQDLPLVVGKPIYLSHEHAMADAVEIFKKAMPEQPITVWPKLASPISKTNAPDSPIVENGKPLDSISEGVASTCNWKGDTYEVGDIICIGGQQHKCKENGWVAIGFKC